MSPTGTIAFLCCLLAWGAACAEAPAVPLQVRFEPAKPHGYFWGRKGKPAGTLVIANSAQQPVTVAVTARLFGHREAPLGKLWQGQVQAESGKPVRQELPLKLERFGVYFVEVQVGDRKERHSLCWLPEPAPVWDESPFGVCTHFGQRKHKVPDTLELVRNMGAAWIRDELDWGGIERKKGEFAFPEHFDRYMQAARNLGIHPLILFDYGNDLYDKGESPRTPEAVAAFAKYCQVLMQRYERECQDWETWNEPNIFFWKPKPNPDDYASLMRAAYQAAKATRPKDTVVGICTAGTDLRFIEAVLQKGGGKWMDAISVHPYRYPRPPEASDFLGEMGRLKALLDKYEAGHLKVWLTEFGYPTQLDPRGVPQHRSAAYIVRTCLLALSLPYVERLFVYDFQDDGTNPTYNEDNFGLIRFDSSPKAGYAAHCTMARMLYRKRFVRAIEAGKDVFCYEFARGRSRVLAAWSAKEAGTLSLAATRGRVTVTDLMGNESVVRAADGRITLPLTEEPTFLSGYGEASPAKP
jgi:hypothetical protein